MTEKKTAQELEELVRAKLGLGDIALKVLWDKIYRWNAFAIPSDPIFEYDHLGDTEVQEALQYARRKAGCVFRDQSRGNVAQAVDEGSVGSNLLSGCGERPSILQDQFDIRPCKEVSHFG